MEATTTAIAEYSKTEAALADLNTRYSMVVFDVTTTKGMVEAKTARAEIKGYRTDLEKERVRIKAPALEHCKLIDAEAKRITAELVKLEEPIDAVIKAEEARKEKEKAEKAAAGAKRISFIQQKLSQIRARVVATHGLSADQILAIKEHAENEVIDPLIYMEFTDEAEMAKMSSVIAIAKAHKAQVEHEQEQAKILAEREELAKLRAAQESQAKELADMKAAEEKRIADERAKIEADKAVGQKRIDDARQAEENKLKEEREAQEAALVKERQAHDDKIRAEQEEADRQKAELQAFWDKKAAEERAAVERVTAAGNIKITVFAYASPEHLLEAAKKAGLSEYASNYLRHCEEFEIELDVEAETGVVKAAQLMSGS